MHIKQVMGGVHLRVRTCTRAYVPLFRSSETAGRIALKFGVLLDTHDLGVLQKCMMYPPTHDLCIMHRYLISKHMPNLVTMGWIISELKPSGQFWHPLRGTRYVREWPPKWAQSKCNQLLSNRPTSLWRQSVNRTYGFADINFSKASLRPVGRPAGRSYSDLSVI